MKPHECIRSRLDNSFKEQNRSVINKSLPFDLNIVYNYYFNDDHERHISTNIMLLQRYIIDTGDLYLYNFMFND